MSVGVVCKKDKGLDAEEEEDDEEEEHDDEEEEMDDGAVSILCISAFN